MFLNANSTPVPSSAASPTVSNSFISTSLSAMSAPELECGTCGVSEPSASYSIGTATSSPGAPGAWPPYILVSA